MNRRRFLSCALVPLLPMVPLPASGEVLMPHVGAGMSFLLTTKDVVPFMLELIEAYWRQWDAALELWKVDIRNEDSPYRKIMRDSVEKITFLYREILRIERPRP